MEKIYIRVGKTHTHTQPLNTLTPTLDINIHTHIARETKNEKKKQGRREVSAFWLCLLSLLGLCADRFGGVFHFLIMCVLSVCLSSLALFLLPSVSSALLSVFVFVLCVCVCVCFFPLKCVFMCVRVLSLCVCMCLSVLVSACVFLLCACACACVFVLLSRPARNKHTHTHVHISNQLVVSSPPLFYCFIFLGM